MGYHVGRFVGEVDVNLLCSICSMVLEDAVLTPCGHSFCQLCLDTWLARPHAPSCPHCRTPIYPHDVHPILSIRNLVNSLDLQCDNEDFGCDVVVTLDTMATHRVKGCGYEQIECAGCYMTLNRCELRTHHNACEIIQNIISKERKSLESDSSEELFKPFSKNLVEDDTVTDLISRVSSLESNLKHIQKDLEKADMRNKKMEKDLKRTRYELEDKCSQVTDYMYVDFDRNYDYGYTQSSITRLSCFISRFINAKPAYIDTPRLFAAMQRCYDNFGHAGEVAEHEVLMLLTTAYASNWFSRTQRVSINCWLQSLVKYKAYVDKAGQCSGECSGEGAERSKTPVSS